MGICGFKGSTLTLSTQNEAPDPVLESKAPTPKPQDTFHSDGRLYKTGIGGVSGFSLLHMFPELKFATRIHGLTPISSLKRYIYAIHHTVENDFTLPSD